MTEASFLPTPQASSAPESSLAGAIERGAVAQVFGAPGFGKTTFVIQRFRHLVGAGLPAEQVLVLAATRESAAELRDSLLLSLGDCAAVEGAMARTVASLAFGIVRQFEIASGGRVPELISGAEQDALVERILVSGLILDEAWPSHINQVTRGLSGFRAELRDLIAACQEYGLSARELAELGKARPEWAAAALVYEQYEALLASPEFEGKLDSPSLINRAIELLNSGAFVPEWAEILVDDAQELTPAAAHLLIGLSGLSGVGLAGARATDGATVGVTLVGDPDAATLGFRQSDPRIMSTLAARLAGARGVKASEHFLQTQVRDESVMRLMHKISGLIPAEGAGPQRRELVNTAEGAGAGPAALNTVVLNSQQAEAEWLAYQLREAKLLAGLPWSKMAVVARTRQQLDALERMLAVEGVPVRIGGAQKALRDEFASRELMELARSCFDDAQPDAAGVERLLRSPFCGLDSVSMRRFRRSLRRMELEASGVGGDAEAGDSAGAAGDSAGAKASARNSDDLLLEAFQTPESLATVRGQDAAKVRRFLKGLGKARQLASDSAASIEDLLWQLWNASGLSQTWTTQSRGIGEIAAQANRNLDAILQLFAAANRFVERYPAGSKQAFLVAQLEQKVPEDSLAIGGSNREFVTLLTPAGLVGRRFELVAIASLIEGIWPNLKPRNSLLGANQLVARLAGRADETGNSTKTEMADELRMFYKAIGASHGRVLVSSYLDEDEQVSQLVAHAYGDGIPKPTTWRTPALTLRGLAGDNRRRLAVATTDAERVRAAVNLARLSEAGVPGAHPDDWYGLLDISSTEPLFEFLPEGAPEPEDEYGDTGSRILVRPSQLEAFVKCPLHWFLNYHGGSTSDFAASVGTLVHRAMELAKSSDEESLWQQVESGWHTLQFESAWLEQAERRKARKLVANLSKYLGQFEASGSRVLAAESDFEFDLGKARIRGKVDRIEASADGGVVIVDLKTGSRAITKDEALKHPQLGLYQLALENGAFAGVDLVGDESLLPDGAKLLLVAGDNFSEKIQPAIRGDDSAREYFEGLVASAAEGMAAPEAVFVAHVSSHCDNEDEFGSCQMHITRAVSHVG